MRELLVQSVFQGRPWQASKCFSAAGIGGNRKLFTFAGMVKSMLKIQALLLCGLLIYNSLGYFWVFSAMQVSIRQQKWAMLASIPKHELTTFSFDKSTSGKGFSVVNEHEIIVDGKLYDVVNKSVNGNKVKYSCARDLKEEKLIAKTRLFNSREHQSPTKNTTRLIIEKVIKTAILNQEAFSVEMKPTFFNTGSILSKYAVPVLSIPLPPPQPSC